MWYDQPPSEQRRHFSACRQCRAGIKHGLLPAAKGCTSSREEVAAIWCTVRMRGNRISHRASSQALGDSRAPWLATTENRVRTPLLRTSGRASMLTPCTPRKTQRLSLSDSRQGIKQQMHLVTGVLNMK